MTFQITEILASKSDHVRAKVLHQGHHVVVEVRAMKDHDIVIGELFQAEIGFDEILDWKAVTDFEDARSGIWQGQDGIHLLGKIHSILDYGDGRTVVDVYIQNGPEFFTVNLTSPEDDALDANDGLEVTVRNLYLHPVS